MNKISVIAANAYFRKRLIALNNDLMGDISIKMDESDKTSLLKEINNFIDCGNFVSPKKTIKILHKYNSNVEFIHILGCIYCIGAGVKQSLLTAVTYFKQAASHGHSGSLYNLGWMYKLGQEVEQSDSMARELFEQAALQRLPQAEFALGLMYEVGKGVEKDLNKARELFEKAAQQGLAEAQFFLGLFYLGEYEVEKDLNKARELFEQAEEQGCAAAQFNLACMYRDGQGIEQDLNIAKSLFEKAAKQGLSRAEFALGHMYQDGQGVEKDLNIALNWFSKALKQGFVPAKRYIESFIKNIMQGQLDAAMEAIYYKTILELGILSPVINCLIEGNSNIGKFLLDNNELLLSSLNKQEDLANIDKSFFTNLYKLYTDNQQINDAITYLIIDSLLHNKAITPVVQHYILIYNADIINEHSTNIINKIIKTQQDLNIVGDARLETIKLLMKIMPSLQGQSSRNNKPATTLTNSLATLVSENDMLRKTLNVKRATKNNRQEERKTKKARTMPTTIILANLASAEAQLPDQEKNVININ